MPQKHLLTRLRGFPIIAILYRKYRVLPNFKRKLNLLHFAVICTARSNKKFFIRESGVRASRSRLDIITRVRVIISSIRLRDTRKRISHLHAAGKARK